MIYANKKIVTIDFKVLDSKEYTFFIDEELCRIKLERRGGEMYYFFEIDKETDTPLNRRRWAREKKHLRQMVVAFGIIALLVAGVVLWSNPDGGASDHQLDELRKQGVEGTGKVVKLPEGENGTIAYQFVSGWETQFGEMDLKTQVSPLSSMKFPLEVGDEFMIRYLPRRPSVSQIFIFRPTKGQIEKYRKRAMSKYAENHPDTPLEKTNCFLDLAYEMDGLDGYAHFYFSKIPPAENSTFNSDTFQKFFNSYLFQSAIKERCEAE